jgi:hypothetical protein
MRGTLIAAALLLSAKLSATSCFMPPPCSLLQTKHVLLVGTVISEGVENFRIRMAQFRVDNLFKGLPLNTAEVSVAVHGDWARKGKTYLLELDERDGVLIPSTCAIHGPVDSEEIRPVVDYLNAWREGKALTTSLRVITSEGARVVVHGPHGRIEDLAGSDGGVTFHDIAPGKYRIETIKDHHVVDEAAAHHTVEVVSGSCPTAFIRMRATASLSGRAVDPNGRPLSNLSLQLAEAGQPVSNNATTDDEGFFQFGNLIPGSYYLGINISDQIRSSPLPQLYYPGVRSKDIAIPIDIAPGETKTDLILTVPDFGPVREITLCVADKSGRRLPDISIDDVDTYDEIGRTDYGGLGDLRTEATGCLKTKAFSKVNYRVFAAGAVDGHLWNSQTVHIPAGREPFTALLIAEPVKYPDLIAK